MDKSKIPGFHGRGCVGRYSTLHSLNFGVSFITNILSCNVFTGKLAAAVIAKRSAGVEDGVIKEVTQEYIDKARSMEKQRPKGIVLGKRGEEALSFGGGVSRAARAQMTSGKELLDMGLTRL